ncbi:MAG: hypothetical protein ABFD89_22690 [Bryobacteraceae bacterium]
MSKELCPDYWKITISDDDVVSYDGVAVGRIRKTVPHREPPWTQYWTSDGKNMDLPSRRGAATRLVTVWLRERHNRKQG